MELVYELEASNKIIPLHNEAQKGVMETEIDWDGEREKRPRGKGRQTDKLMIESFNTIA